jgi:hypothetical protein
MNRWLFGPGLGLVAAAVAVAVSACGTADTSTAGQPAGSGSAPAAPPVGPRGASGAVAALSGSTLQVQNARTGQVTVTFTPSTSFTRTVAAAAADLAVGDCALAVGASAPTSSPAVPAGPVTATSVMISPATADGGCPAGGPGGPGRGARPAGGGRGARAAGKITSISGSGFVLQTSNVTRAVTTTQATTFSKTVATDHSALAVGQCVTTVGPSGDTGTVAASSISIRQPGPQGCQGGFSGPGGSRANR